MIVLGKIINLQGKKGELRFRPYEGTEALLAPEIEIYLKKERNLIPYRLESLKKSGREYIIKLSGIDAADEILFCLGQEVLFPEENLPSLAEDEFYEFELRGATVRTRDQAEVGQVTGFWEVSGKTLMVVEKDKREILVPFEEAICISIDVANKLIIIDPPEGLLDLNEV